MPHLSFDSKTTTEKVALNSFKEMVPGLPLNFSILLEELLTSMVYMHVQVTTCNEIYDVGMKTGAATSVPHWLTVSNGLWCTVDVV